MQISAIPAGSTPVSLTPVPVSGPVEPAPVPPSVGPVPGAPAPTPVDPTPTTPVDPVVPVEPVAPSKLIQKLASGHFNPVADLRHRMKLAGEIAAAKVQLPEPPASPGHGKAYDKFMAAYRAMQPGETSTTVDAAA